MKRYFNEIKPYLKDITSNLQISGKREIRLTIAINFTSSKDNDEEQVKHLKSDNIEVMTYDNANEFIKEIFESHFSRYQIELETSRKGNDFVFDCVI